MKFDLTTKEGLEQARQFIANKRRNDAIAQFHAALDAEQNVEALEDQLKELDTLNRFIDAAERPRVEITAWGDIEESPREWLIPQWLPANTVTMFTGEGGAGKSWLTLQAVCQIACGFRNAYLDPDFKKNADVDQRRHVVFATYEDEPAEIKRRLQALASGMPWIKDSLTAIHQHVHIADMRGVGSVWGPGIGKHIANTGDLLSAGEDLRSICEEKKARLLVMDPLSGAFGGNENDRTAVYDFVSSFRGWGDDVGCAMLVIGHLPKSAEGKAAGFSGSTAWEASARAMWMLSKKSFAPEDEAKEKKKTLTRYYWALEHTKSNYAQLQGDIPLHKHKEGRWSKARNIIDAADAFDEYQQSREYNPQEDTDDGHTVIPDF